MLNVFHDNIFDTANLYVLDQPKFGNYVTTGFLSDAILQFCERLRYYLDISRIYGFERATLFHICYANLVMLKYLISYKI